MIPPGTVLHIYEIRGDVRQDVPDPPSSFIGVWNEDELLYLFFTQAENEYIDTLVGAQGWSVGSHHEMKYEDWQTGIPTQGIRLGGIHFVGWQGSPARDGSIRLDPSVVFGDGNHPTTMCCLQFLEQIVRSRTVGSMLDLGSGTGILSLAAAAMGVRHIWAVDKNHLAVLTTRKNVQANSLTGVIHVESGEARLFVDKPFDIVVANLPFHVLRDLVTMDGVSRHKAWVVSGTNREQGEVLQALLREQDHYVQMEREHPPWFTFATVNRFPKR